MKSKSELPYVIECGAPAQVQDAVNDLVDSHTPILWHAISGSGGMEVLVILMSRRELRQMSITPAIPVPVSGMRH